MALWLFGSLVLRFSARPWPLALLSEVGLALRCVLWFALVCDRCTRVPPSRPSRAFRGHLALHGDPGSLEPSASLRRSASFSAIAPWDRLAAPRSTTTAPGSCFWISPNLLGGFCSLWPVLAWVVRGQFWPGLFGPVAVRGYRRFVFAAAGNPPAPSNLLSYAVRPGG